MARGDGLVVVALAKDGLTGEDVMVVAELKRNEEGNLKTAVWPLVDHGAGPFYTYGPQQAAVHGDAVYVVGRRGLEEDFTAIDTIEPFVMKLSLAEGQQGQILWTKPEPDTIYMKWYTDLVVRQNGDVIAVGNYIGNDPAGYMFISKFTSDGELVWTETGQDAIPEDYFSGCLDEGYGWACFTHSAADSVAIPMSSEGVGVVPEDARFVVAGKFDQRPWVAQYMDTGDGAEVVWEWKLPYTGFVDAISVDEHGYVYAVADDGGPSTDLYIHKLMP